MEQDKVEMENSSNVNESALSELETVNEADVIDSAAADSEVISNKIEIDKSYTSCTRQRHACASCTRTFSTKRDLVTHQYMHRENPTFLCSTCSKSFTSELSYRRHIQTHCRKSVAAAVRRQYMCSQCGVIFETMKQLSAHHAAKHVDEKRFVCGICGSQFAWPENLRAHHRTHEVNPHECATCGRRFVDATSLRVHMRNSHGPNSEPAVPRKAFSCHLCGRAYQFDFSLRAHMKGHAQSPAHHVTNTVSAASEHAPIVDTNNENIIDMSSNSEIIVEVFNFNSSVKEGQQESVAAVALDENDVMSLQNEATENGNVLNDSNLPLQQANSFAKSDSPECEHKLAQESLLVESEQTNNVDTQQHTDSKSTAFVWYAPPQQTPSSWLKNSEVEQNKAFESVEKHTAPSLILHSAAASASWIEDDIPEVKRAPPYVYKSASSSRTRRTPRQREPFMFNCIMTNEKPFICTVCGESFRWEISLNIHQRLHTEGTFPNQSRRPVGRLLHSGSSTLHHSSKNPSSTVAHSRIVQRHASSDEDENDEFNFVAQNEETQSSQVRRSSRKSVSTPSAQWHHHRGLRARQRGNSKQKKEANCNMLQQPDVSETVSVCSNESKVIFVTVEPVDVQHPSSLDHNSHNSVAVTDEIAIGHEIVSLGDLVASANSIVTIPPVDNCLAINNNCQLSNLPNISLSACSFVGSRIEPNSLVWSKNQEAHRRAAFICRKCRSVVTTMVAARRHRRRHTLIDNCRNTLACSSCPACFTSRSDLLLHYRICHSAWHHKCQTCRRVFSSEVKLKQHQRLHNLIVSPTVCQVCAKRHFCQSSCMHLSTN